MSKKDGGPAFPLVYEWNNPQEEAFNQQALNWRASVSAQPVLAVQKGMSLRDYFAAKAMQSIIVNPQAYSSVRDNLSMAVKAYQMADAMLTVRNVE